jgi:hypothetical protein
MFVWIKKPEMRELEAEEVKDRKYHCDAKGHLWTCEAKSVAATLTICKKQIVPKIKHDDFLSTCDEGNLSHCSGDGNLHCC